MTKTFKDITVTEDQFTILKLIRNYQFSLECEMDNLEPSIALMKATQKHNGTIELMDYIYNVLKESQNDSVENI